ncbi:MAG: PAS domain S-box protein [Planctomycetota bacterium]|jgi:PAS domain S-box-containing protein
MWTSLRARFVVLMLLTTGGATAATILIIGEIERNEALRAVEQEEAALIETVQQVVSRSFERGVADQQRLQMLTEQLAQTTDLQWVEVFDDQARVIAHSDRTRLGQEPLSLHRESVERILAGGEPITEEDPEQERFRLFVPVPAGAGTASPQGVIEVVLSWEPGQPVPSQLAQTAATAAQAELAQALINANIERAQLQRLTKNLARRDTLKWVEIFDHNAVVIAHSRPDRFGLAPLPRHSATIRKVVQTGRQIRQVPAAAEEPVLFMPISSRQAGAGALGVVEVVIDPVPILTRLSRSQARYLWAFVIIGSAAVAGLSISSEHLIFQPLEQVAHAARDIAHGRIGTTVNADCAGPIRNLVDAFNWMSRSLQSTMVSRDELAVSEERLQLALEATHTSCWDVQLENDDVRSTQTIEPVLGYDPSEVAPSRQWWHNLVHPDDIAIKEQALQDYLAGSVPVYECEYRIRAASGEWRWTLDRGHAIARDENGRPTIMVGTDTDITRLKRDEQLLYSQNRVLKAIATGEPLSEVLSLVIELVETAEPDAISSVRLLNRETQRLHGIGKNRLPESYNCAIDGLQTGPGVGSCGTAAFTGKRVIVADVMTHDDWSEYRDLAEAAGIRACWSEPILDRDGEVLGTLAIYHDVPREPAEEALSAIQFAARLSAIAIQRDQAIRDLRVRDRALAYCGNGVVIVDAMQPDQPVIYCNQAFARITGYSASEILGRNCRLLQSGDPNQAGLEEIRNAMREQRSCRVTLRNIRRNGEPFWNDLTISPVFDNDGQLTHFVGIQDDVSRRLDSETELIHSELRFRTLVEFAPEAITVFDVETMRFVDVNQNAVELFGVDRDSLLSQGPMDFSPETQPDGRSSQEMSSEMIARTLAGEAPTFEWMHLKPDGTLTPTEVRLVQFPSDERQLIRGSVTDISERKRIENTLRQAEARFRDLYDLAHDMYLTVDIESLCIVDCNRTTLDRLGYSHDQIIGQNVLELYAPNCAEQVTQNVSKFRRTGRLDSVELQVLRADGSVIDVSLSASAIRNDDGTIVESRSIWRDITKRKQAERERTEALTRFESIASNIPDCFWRTRIHPDGNYEVEYVSPAWTAIWGYAPEDIYNHPDLWIEAVFDEDRDIARQAFERVLTTGERQTASFRVRTKNGQIRWIEDRMSAVLDESGHVILLEGVARDMTEQRNAEELARQQMEQLAHVDRLTTVGELATGIAHELNQPLTAIVNTSYVCEKKLARNGSLTSEELQQSVSMISKEAFRASEIIRRLRSLVKRTPMRVSDFDVNATINDVISLIQPEAQQHRISIEPHLNSSLPLIVADEVQFQQVILNLLKNACDALITIDSDPRQIVVETELSDSQSVLISVSDNGVGLPDEAVDQAFDAFFTTKDEGMGMGLAISRSIIETHCGRMWAENNSQGGATFRLTLPTTQKRRRRA